QDEYEAYKATLNLNWSNPNRDQEIEKANAKLAETQQKQAQVMSRLQDILTKAYPKEMAEKKFSLDIPSGGYTMYHQLVLPKPHQANHYYNSSNYLWHYI
ncbi:TonB-dependent receptor plug protein, partial [human gut metagenome]